MTIIIDGFENDYRWLSNFWIEPDKTHVEAEYQAEKHRGHPWRMATIMRQGPKKAKKLGRRWKLNTYQQMEWDHRKIQIMTSLVRQKIEDHPEIAVALIATEGIDLVEKNNWHDNFWGDCSCLRCYKIGENQLGKVWMALRDELGT
ncbi:MAG TPA: NADAR family protein [Nitrospiraceae bacterium]|nr:NADAR family protein [Nitrospiraceae bacterium]